MLVCVTGLCCQQLVTGCAVNVIVIGCAVSVIMYSGLCCCPVDSFVAGSVVTLVCIRPVLSAAVY